MDSSGVVHMNGTFRFRYWVYFNVTIKVKMFTNINCTQSIKALHQGDGQYGQYQISKKSGAIVVYMDMYVISIAN